MSVIKQKPTSPGRRGMVRVVSSELHKGKPVASLVESKNSISGRNSAGRITVRHRGGGHKRHYRLMISSHKGRYSGSCRASRI